MGARLGQDDLCAALYRWTQPSTQHPPARDTHMSSGMQIIKSNPAATLPLSQATSITARKPFLRSTLGNHFQRRTEEHFQFVLLYYYWVSQILRLFRSFDHCPRPNSSWPLDRDTLSVQRLYVVLHPTGRCSQAVKSFKAVGLRSTAVEAR